ncbi:hypothetical protein TELCIR_02638 [Teladorsagia circumcincta]|uniref:Uncharacterized protein n=1 Tax=Teladorsagia circumcincta TaxID=45464 RepID=A0A2G9UYM5_TELCI|nr:hypothetical protein TELCIR_02638 [Teladorsagia circumcincta]
MAYISDSYNILEKSRPCCSLLSQSALPRRAPLLATFQQCSILRRASSNCPADGYVFCDAAPDTNPTTMQIEFFNTTGSVVRTVQSTGTSLNARVSCSQTGSIGADWGYVVGSATD